MTNAQRTAAILEEPSNGFDLMVTVDPGAHVDEQSVADALMDAIGMLRTYAAQPYDTSRAFKDWQQFSIHQVITYTKTGSWLPDGDESLPVAIVIQVVPRD